MVKLSNNRFEELVAQALDALPERFREKLDNVDVVIEEEPTEEQRRENDTPEGDTLFGLYEGVPQAARGDGYTFVLPDKITIFQKPILEACESEDEVMNEVRATVVHEIAHHFGISDDRLEEIGKY